ncbi:MAG: lysozyme [Duncaniella sp.]|nr:lysozyme [Duncaniella sp.]
MELSQKIKQMIKGWEGCKLTAYRCPAGVLTIGYGHTGADVTPGKTITQAEADRLFDADVRKFAEKVAPLFSGVVLNNNQFDALVSLSYNIGSLSVKAPKLLRKVKANPNDPSIRAEFLKHVNARVNGVLKQLPGLVKRRTAEANHYFGQL